MNEPSAIAARILVVDDDLDGADALADLLEIWGYTVDIANDLHSAVERIDEFAPNVAFVDVRLGRDSGFDVIARINRCDGPPVAIVMTANADRETVIEAIRAGAFDYLPKPVDPDEMRHALDKALTLFRLNAENRRMVEELRVAKEQAERLASTDWLTDLPNRRALYARLDEFLSGEGAAETDFAFILVDLDGFKPVNDSFGHQTGDKLLQLVGQRMLRLIGSGDMVARLGGDEFGILVPKAEPTTIQTLAKSLIDRLSTPFVIDGVQVEIGASAGVCLHTGGDITIDRLVRQTDDALYLAKSEGRGRFVFAGSTTNKNLKHKTDTIKNSADIDIVCK